jgi:hypothetical protein
MGETRVDLYHLLEDLRDAYPGSLEETILTEIVANSLDSGADRIAFTTDGATATLTVTDNGRGMQRRDLARYHDIAASSKTRGEGIGFAGVGIKLALLLCEEVVTETRRGKTHVATRWHLASRHRAPWKWIEPPDAVAERGTAVRLRQANALSPLLDAGFIETAVRRHFEPLFDARFDELLATHYPRGVTFSVNGTALVRRVDAAGEEAPIAIRLAHKRKPSALGYLARSPYPLPEDRRGVAVSTYGKIIKRGWDWLGVTPQTPERCGGLIEAPGLASTLTLNKADFIRTGPRGAAYLAYRKAAQEAVTQQLAAWGDARDADESAHRRVARPVERDLERVLVELAADFPLLAALVERRTGGQRKLPMGSGAGETEARGLVAAAIAKASGSAEPGSPVPPETTDAGDSGSPPGESAPPPAVDRDSPPGPLLPDGRGPRRPGRYGLAIQFESRPDDIELGRLIESTVWVNEAHPAYRRAVESRSEGYHVALAVALALAPLAVTPPEEHGFVTSFLAAWGELLGRPPGSRRRAPRPVPPSRR